MLVDSDGWSGEGSFTQNVLDRLRTVDGVAAMKVEDAPATRSEADYNFIANEIFVTFATRVEREPTRRLGLIPAVRRVTVKAMTFDDLVKVLEASEGIGPADYSDDGMIQYLRAERIIPPYQTKGYKLIELVRIYEAKPRYDVPDSSRSVLSLTALSAQLHADPSASDAGRDRFQASGQCLTCHRVDGQGSETARDLSWIGVLRTPEKLRAAVVNQSLHPGLSLSPSAVDELVAYLRTLRKMWALAPGTSDREAAPTTRTRRSSIAPNAKKRNGGCALGC